MLDQQGYTYDMGEEDDFRLALSIHNLISRIDSRPDERDEERGENTKDRYRLIIMFPVQNPVPKYTCSILGIVHHISKPPPLSLFLSPRSETL